jgi:hypothetical protein
VDWRELLFPEDVRSDVEAAWSNLEPRFAGVKDRLGSIPDTRVDEAGLSGSQLNLKLTGFRGAVDRFKQKGTVKLLKKLLEWINIVLKSLASIVPGGEALKEFKEAIEKYIKDNED